MQILRSSLRDRVRCVIGLALMLVGISISAGLSTPAHDARAVHALFDLSTPLPVHSPATGSPRLILIRTLVFRPDAHVVPRGDRRGIRPISERALCGGAPLGTPLRTNCSQPVLARKCVAVSC